MCMTKITRDDGSAKGYERVLRFLRGQLLSGELRPGDFLLPERDLCAQLGVSRPALREALRALSLIGAVEIRHGVGTVVGRPNISAIGEYFTFALAQQPDAVDDIMEARIAVEHRAIRLAVERATPADFDRLEDALQRIEETIDDPATGAEADLRFHASIVRAAHSPSLQGIYSAIKSLMRQSHVARRKKITAVEGINDYLINHHRLVFIALVERDADKADQLLADHFTIGRDFDHRATVQASRAALSLPLEKAE